MQDKQLIDVIHDAIEARLKPKCCIITDATGNSTGNILKYKDTFYIVTCKHVADSFFNKSNQYTYVILKGNSRIYPDKLKYIASTDDKIDTDIALIEILDTTHIKEYFEESDLQIVDNFKDINSENSFFFILGFPQQLNSNIDNRQIIRPFSYGVNKSTIKNSDENFIYLEYEMNKERRIIHEKELRMTLPKAFGLSGAFIFKIDKFEGKIWNPSIAKAIAVQSSWKEKEGWIKGSNIKFLFQLLP